MPNPDHPSTPRLDSHSSASVGSEYLYPLDVTVAIYLQPSLFEMLPCPLHVLESIYVGHALTGPNWRCGHACQLSVLPALMGRSVKDVLDHETDRERYDVGLDLTGAPRQGRKDPSSRRSLDGDHPGNVGLWVSWGRWTDRSGECVDRNFLFVSQAGVTYAVIHCQGLPRSLAVDEHRMEINTVRLGCMYILWGIPSLWFRDSRYLILP